MAQCLRLCWCLSTARARLKSVSAKIADCPLETHGGPCDSLRYAPTSVPLKLKAHNGRLASQRHFGRPLWPDCFHSIMCLVRPHTSKHKLEPDTWRNATLAGRAAWLIHAIDMTVSRIARTSRTSRRAPDWTKRWPVSRRELATVLCAKSRVGVDWRVLRHKSKRTAALTNHYLLSITALEWGGLQ